MSSQSSDKLSTIQLQEQDNVNDPDIDEEDNDVENEEQKQNDDDKEDDDFDNEENAESDDNEDIVEDEDDDEDEDDEDEFDLDEDGEVAVSKTVGKKTTTKRTKTTTGTSDDIIGLLNMNDDDMESSDEEDEEQVNGIMDEEYDDEDDEDLDTYLQKFDEEVNTNYLLQEHPNEFNKNYDEIDTLCNIVRDENNNIIDPLHKTLPYLSKYERTRVLGQRAKQINAGAKSFIAVPDNIIDGYIIAEMELLQKRIPFIIQRPLHGGVTEYWKLRDLEIL
jgi:DNA-directed RNA polymerase subunit K/omega